MAVCLVAAPASRLKSATRDASFLQSHSKCWHYVNVLFNVTPRYLDRSKRAGFNVVVDFQPTFSFLVEMEDCQHCFCSAELQIPGLEIRPVTSLEHRERRRVFKEGPNFLNYVQYFQTKCNTFFHGVENFSRGVSPPGYGPAGGRLITYDYHVFA